MKNVAILVLLVCVPAVFAAEGVDSWSIGPSLGFYVPENSWGAYYANNDPALGLGVDAHVRFDLGSAGELVYAPKLDGWFRADDWDDVYRNSTFWADGQSFIDRNFAVELRDFNVDMNFFNARYYPPLDKVKPYAELALLTISVYYWSEEIQWKDGGYFHNNGGDTEAAVGADIAAGCEFHLNDSFYPWFEVRYSGSNDTPDAFKLRAGISFIQD
ncbi:MAG: hypothetical protein ACQEQV_07815 [Fibrobacterota bacterium]